MIPVLGEFIPLYGETESSSSGKDVSKKCFSIVSSFP